MTLFTNPVVISHINDLIKKYKEEKHLSKAAMQGVFNDLKNLKPLIEQLYEDKIFYLNYWESECPWHGWNWSKDDGTLQNMAEITEGISDRFEEIYALILIGLGYNSVEEMIEKEKNNDT